MAIIFYGTALFLAGLALHLAWWRISVPKRQTKTLLFIFFAVLIAGCAWLAFQPGGFAVSGVPRPRGAWEFMRVALYVTALTLAYMITYSAVEADSPSLLIALAVARAGENGLPPDEITRLLDDNALVTPRLADLLKDKMAALEDGRYIATPKGRLFARIFIFHRAVLGAGKGG